jgi:hypothetical protein
MKTTFAGNLRSWTNNIRNGKAGKMILAGAFSLWSALGATQAFALPAAGGNDTNVNIVVPACTTLNTQFVLVAGNAVRYCVATGSADIGNPGAVGVNTYAFNLTLDQPAATICNPLDGGKERTVQFSNVPVAGQLLSDNRIKEITSTGFFRIAGPGVHIIRWTARPIPGSPASTVLDRSLSVVCTDVPLPN